MTDDLRDRYTDALAAWARTYAIDAWNLAQGETADRLAHAWGCVAARRVMAVRDAELERLRAAREAYSIVHGQLKATREEYSELMDEMLKWRQRAKKAERSLTLLTATTPPLPDGSDDDEARRGHAERTIDQWRKYATHWRARAETAEAERADLVERIARRVETACSWPDHHAEHGPCDYQAAAVLIRAELRPARTPTEDAP